MAERNAIKDRTCGECGAVITGTAATMLLHIQVKHRRSRPDVFKVHVNEVVAGTSGQQHRGIL